MAITFVITVTCITIPAIEQQTLDRAVMILGHFPYICPIVSARERLFIKGVIRLVKELTIQSVTG